MLDILGTALGIKIVNDMDVFPALIDYGQQTVIHHEQ